MVKVSSFLAVLAAVSFAFGSVLQQRGTLDTDAAEGDPRFLAEILRKPVWLLGAGCQGVGWVLQAVALARGTLVVVQSLCALSLVIALPLGKRLTAQHVDRRAILGAVAALAGIVVFIAIGQPSGGTGEPSAASWWISGFLSLVVMGTLALVARRRGGAPAAALFAGAAGICFAYQAAVTKVFVDVVGSGLGPIVTSWTTYVLVLSALVGFAIQQSALKTGFLAPALASSNATTLLASILLGILVFDEVLAASTHRVVGLGALVAAIGGIIVLATPQSSNSVDQADPSTPSPAGSEPGAR